MGPHCCLPHACFGLPEMGMAWPGAPQMLEKAPLGQGRRFCCSCWLLSAAQCDRRVQRDAGWLWRSHPGRESQR